jgi:hypothetical protein
MFRLEPSPRSIEEIKKILLFYLIIWEKSVYFLNLYQSKEWSHKL